MFSGRESNVKYIFYCSKVTFLVFICVAERGVSFFGELGEMHLHTNCQTPPFDTLAQLRSIQCRSTHLAVQEVSLQSPLSIFLRLNFILSATYHFAPRALALRRGINYSRHLAPSTGDKRVASIIHYILAVDAGGCDFPIAFR